MFQLAHPLKEPIHPCAQSPQASLVVHTTKADLLMFRSSVLIIDYRLTYEEDVTFTRYR